MSAFLTDLLLLFLLTVLNGVFAMSEIALVSSRKVRLQSLSDEGSAGAKKALELYRSPSRFLSTIQVGITSIGILSGAVGEKAISAPLAGWLVGKVHPGILGGIGLSMMAAGCFFLSFVPADTDHFGLVLRLMLCGAGFGFFQSPNNHLLLSSAPPQRSGSASGMLATARLTGQTFGAALVALLFHLFGTTAPHDAMLLAGCLTVCAAVCSCMRLKEKMV